MHSSTRKVQHRPHLFKYEEKNRYVTWFNQMGFIFQVDFNNTTA